MIFNVKEYQFACAGSDLRTLPHLKPSKETNSTLLRAELRRPAVGMLRERVHRHRHIHSVHSVTISTRYTDPTLPAAGVPPRSL